MPWILDPKGVDDKSPGLVVVKRDSLPGRGPRTLLRLPLQGKDDWGHPANLGASPWALVVDPFEVGTELRAFRDFSLNSTAGDHLY
jgi:hypothetical protein